MSRPPDRNFLPSNMDGPPVISKRSMDRGFNFDISPDEAAEERKNLDSPSYLPPVNFDNFQAAFASFKPQDISDSEQVESFGIGRKMLPSQGFANSKPSNDAQEVRRIRMPEPEPEPEPELPLEVEPERSPVTTRKKLVKLQPRPKQAKNSGAGAPQPSDESSNVIQSNPPLSIRTRRQSQLPSVSRNNSNARPPRKSVAPNVSNTQPSTAPAGRSGLEQSSSLPTLSYNVSRTPSLSKGSTLR